MTGQRAALRIVMVRHVNHEGRCRGFVDEVVRRHVRFPRFAFGGIPAKATIEDRVGEHVAGGDVIRMPVRPVRERDRPRPRATDEFRGAAHVIVVRTDPAVRPSKVDPPRGAEHLARRFRFGQTLVDRAVAPHLSRRQIAKANAKPHRRVLRDAAAQTNFEIIWMGSEDKQINWFHHNSPTKIPWELGLGTCKLRNAYRVNPQKASSFSDAS